MLIFTKIFIVLLAIIMLIAIFFGTINLVLYTFDEISERVEQRRIKRWLKAREETRDRR